MRGTALCWLRPDTRRALPPPMLLSPRGAEDSAGRLGSVTVRAKIKGVAPHENLTGFRGYARFTIANVEAVNMINDNGAIFVNNPVGATLSKESGGLVFRPSPTSAKFR